MTNVARQPDAIDPAMDRHLMARAISLARRGEGFVEPNPMVGCVLARHGRVIAEGYHRRFGGPHAEVVALKRCTADPRGATMYVSLEPCSHHGKTPPCTQALIRAGIGRVVIGTLDPNPLVHGRGVRQLRAAGIRVDRSELSREAAELIAPYATRLRLGRPYVIAKWAQSLDGKLATSAGQSRWISSEASRKLVHRLRARVDAILVGSGTVLADDPLLTARNLRLRRQALRVVLDGRLRIPPTCRLVRTARSCPTLVLTSAERAVSRRARQLKRNGVDVCGVRASRGRLQLPQCLRLLAQCGATNVLVEGGPTLLAALFNARLIDEAFVFTAPILIGDTEAPSAVSGRKVTRLDAAIVPHSVRVTRCGPDVLHRLRFSPPTPPR